MKTATVQARIQPKLKTTVEGILRKLGLSPSDAIMLYYSQIALNQGLPFEIKIPNRATQKAIEEARSRRTLSSARNADELMAKLGVKL